MPDFGLAILVLGASIDRVNDLACLLGTRELAKLLPWLCLYIVRLLPPVDAIVRRLMKA